MDVTRRHSRPFGVTVIVLLHVAALLPLGLTALLLVIEQKPVAQTLVRSDAFTILGFTLDALGLVAAFGLWRMRRWAWILAMILTGISMVVDITAYMRGTLPYIPMLINVITVFYLNQGEVRRVFEHPSPAYDSPAIEVG